MVRPARKEDKTMISQGKTLKLLPSHLKAMSRNAQLVIGPRGSGKSFWWGALQNPYVRAYLEENSSDRNIVRKEDWVWAGFSNLLNFDVYPDKFEFYSLMHGLNIQPRLIWRTLVTWLLSPAGHPIVKLDCWDERARYVVENPEPVDHLLYDVNQELNREGQYQLILFDALEHSAYDKKDLHRLVRGLLMVALDFRSFSNIRAKVFLRPDQIHPENTFDFVDSSKLLSESVELSVP